MDKISGKQEHLKLAPLRREWTAYLIFTVLLLLGGFFILIQVWERGHALGWLGIAAGISIYQLWFVYSNLADNRLNAPASPLFPDFGLANWLTFIRAILNAMLAGFVVGPWPAGWLGWAPSVLYLVSAVMDFLDGFAARVSGRTTILGEKLDMKWDGAGAGAAALLSALYGQTPLPFILVGLARYLYLFGIWARTRRDLPIYDLPPNRFRRPFAGMMMGFLAVVLMPVYYPPATLVAGWLFMLPFLANFFRDWLFTSGVLGQSLPGTAQPSGIWRGMLPVLVRIILVALLIELLVHVLGQKPLAVGMIAVLLLSIPAIALGAAGRLFALAVLLLSGFGLQIYPLEWRFWAILLFGTASMMVGSGKYSLWRPEDWLLFKYAGENHTITRAKR